MPKLQLKRTPDEEAAHRLQKQKRRDARHRREHVTADSSHSHHKRRRKDGTNGDTAPPWASSDGEPEDECGPHPAPSSQEPQNNASANLDYDALRAELEEQRFREKMFGAFEDDERLDSLEARFNDFAHIPGRWRSSMGGKPGRSAHDEDLGDVKDIAKMDPRYMDEEEYTEWIRVGMYRKTHAEEYAEHQRQKALKAARRAEDAARKAETKRLEKAAEEERKRKKLERESRRWDYAREEYDIRWKELLSGGGDSHLDSRKTDLIFSDIPWPIISAHRQKPDKRSKNTSSGPGSISLESLTTVAISEFLLPQTSIPLATRPPLEDIEKRQRKEKLRETFLRFHPDKFEGRFMDRIKASERDRVREAISQVVRVLNVLMNDVA